MNINLYIIIFLLQTITYVQAQVPGYQGKRLIVEGNANLSFFYGFRFLFLDEPTFNDKKKALEDINFIIPQITLDYAITRKTSLGLVYSTRSNTFEAYIPNKLTYTIVKHAVTTHDIRLKYTWYRKTWSLAPVGKYCYISAGSILALPKIIQNTPSTVNKFIFSDFSFQFGYGKRYMINDRLTFNYGVEVGVLANLLYKHDVGSVTDQTTYEKAVENEYTRTTYSDYLFKISLGLGGLF